MKSENKNLNTASINIQNVDNLNTQDNKNINSNDYAFDKLFDPDFFNLADYTRDILNLDKRYKWRLPLRWIDKLHLYFALFFTKISWFANDLKIEKFTTYTPFYKMLFNFLWSKNINVGVSGNHGAQDFSTFNIASADNNFNGSGFNKDKEKALSAALGEFLERYFAGSFCKEDKKKLYRLIDIQKVDNNFKRNRGQEKYLELKDLSNKKVSIYFPNRYNTFNKDQLQKYNYLSSEFDIYNTLFLEGDDLLNKNKKTLISAKMIKWNDKNLFKGEKNYINSTTNGSAGFFDKDTAIIKGILELIERDSFLCYWLSMSAPDIIDTASLTDEHKSLIAIINSYNFDVFVLDTMTDIGVPTVCTVALSRNVQDKGLFLSGGAGFCYEDAIRSSLHELIGCYRQFSSKKEVKAKDAWNNNVYVPFNNNIDRDDRINIWRGEFVHHADFFLRGNKVSLNNLININSLNKNILNSDRVLNNDIVSNNDVILNNDKVLNSDKVLNNLIMYINKNINEHDNENGLQIAVYETKNKILQSLGFYVVQVFINYCLSLYLFEHFATLNSVRLHKFAKYKKINKLTINIYPHPYP